jgi:putative oxidoreductase
MLSFMKAYENQTYALLRILSGFAFLLHGSQKLLGFPPTERVTEGFVLYIGGPIELIGGALIMIGLFVRPAAFLASGMMAWAYWLVHFSGENYLPVMNRGDAAALYSLVFLYICTKGSGIWSVDGGK